MPDEYMEMCKDLEKLISSNKSVSGNSLFEILREYLSAISVFDMMAFSSHVIEENKYVQENYREDSQKSYIESFLYRVRDIPKDAADYSGDIDGNALRDAIATLKANHDDETSSSKSWLIFSIASLYATFLLEEPIHPVGTPFPGSLKVEERRKILLSGKGCKHRYA